MAAEVKRPFYKKWWFWLIAVIVVIALFSGEEEDPEVAEENVETTEDITEEAAEETEEEPEAPEEAEVEEPEEALTEISAGTYIVGDDIPAGEYLVFSDGMGYIEAAQDSTGQLESIIFNDNLMNDAHAYVTLEDGQYFKLQRAYMYPVEEAPSIKPEDGVYTDGMYKVGEDIPAGEYKVTLSDTSVVGMGYLEVSSNSSHRLENIITNDNVQADTYITIEDGQYLKLQDLTITMD